MIVVAVIPAKSVSRRVPGKNLRLLAGQPMFCHSVDVARATPGIDAVLVSSDSAEILQSSALHGARPMSRPLDLCGDTATNFQVLQHLLATLRAEGTEPDVLVLLQPTTPFRTPSPLGAMLGRLLANPDADSLVVVVPAQHIHGRVEKGRWLPDVPATQPGQRMKPVHKTYELSGHAYLLRPQQTLDRGNLLGDVVLAEPLPETWLDVDIDTPNDWLLAEGVAHTFFNRDA
jgi:CMP-N-acetylneuraminic acid synthetase